MRVRKGGCVRVGASRRGYLKVCVHGIATAQLCPAAAAGVSEFYSELYPPGNCIELLTARVYPKAQSSGVPSIEHKTGLMQKPGHHVIQRLSRLVHLAGSRLTRL
jgi:hypothetical protein